MVPRQLPEGDLLVLSILHTLHGADLASLNGNRFNDRIFVNSVLAREQNGTQYR